MLKREDVLIVEVTDQMIFDAVHYAEKSVRYTFNRMGSSNLYDRVRNIVKGLIMESAFKRLLDVHQVKYDLLGNTHWTKKDRYDVGIDGHKYDIKGFHVVDAWKAQAIQKDLGWLLDCSALVPSDQINAKSLKDDDLYVFPLMIGEFERNSVPNLFTINRHRYLVHCFWDYSWIKNDQWKSLGHITIGSHLNKKAHIRIGGQGENRELVVEEFDLSPGTKVTTTNEFFTLLFTHTNEYPQGDIVIQRKSKGKQEPIRPGDWGNIWVYDGVVYFTGFLSKKEFKLKSVEIPRFYKDCKQYGETKTVNRKMLIQDLNPISSLLPNNYQKVIKANQ
jgi:hypothetical protein